jgi:ion channel-forming bestrophin family protein
MGSIISKPPLLFSSPCCSTATSLSRDLYYLVKFLPAYALPPGIPEPGQADLSGASPRTPTATDTPATFLSIINEEGQKAPIGDAEAQNSTTATQQRLGIQSANSFIQQRTGNRATVPPIGPASSDSVNRSGADSIKDPNTAKFVLHRADEQYLLPANSPPAFYILDLFPFSLLVRVLTKRGKELKGKKAARLRARMQKKLISHNLPLEISLYLVS